MSDDIELEIMLYFPTDCNDLGMLLPSLVVPLRFSKPPEHATSLLPHFLLPLQGIGDENWRHKRKTSWIKIRKIYSNSNSIDEVYKKGPIYTKTPPKTNNTQWLCLPGSLDQKEPLLSTPDSDLRWDRITSKPCALAAAKMIPDLATASTQTNQIITS